MTGQALKAKFPNFVVLEAGLVAGIVNSRKKRDLKEFLFFASSDITNSTYSINETKSKLDLLFMQTA